MRKFAAPFAPWSREFRVVYSEMQLLEARERHFERWPEMGPEDGPEGEVEILREFYRARVPWISSQRP